VGQTQVLAPLAALAEAKGEYERAAELHEKGLRLTEDLGLWAEAADRLTSLSGLRLLAGDHPGARKLYEQARNLAAEHSHRPGVARAEQGLARVALPAPAD
jgi:hypothetical protein